MTQIDSSFALASKLDEYFINLVNQGVDHQTAYPSLLNATPVAPPNGGLKVDASIPTGPIASQVHIGANKTLFHGVPGGPMTRIGTVEDADSVHIARTELN